MTQPPLRRQKTSACARTGLHRLETPCPLRDEMETTKTGGGTLMLHAVAQTKRCRVYGVM